MHIRKEHMGETEAKAPTRGPSAAPNSWFISEELIGRASQIEKHRFVRPSARPHVGSILKHSFTQTIEFQVCSKHLR